jgi:AcrR family transcriptional regulator
MQQRSEETKAHILEAAQRLFSQNGYDATGVAEICEAAGISKGAFYHHYPTKQAIFLELLEHWLSGVDAGLETLQQGAANVPQTLLRMTRIFPVVFQAAEQLPIFLEFWRQASRDKVVWKATIAPYRRYRKFFDKLVQQAIDEGSFRAMNPQAASQAILSMATGLLLQGILDPQGADWPQVAQQSIQLLLDGLVKRESSDQ